MQVKSLKDSLILPLFTASNMYALQSIYCNQYAYTLLAVITTVMNYNKLTKS